MTLTLFIKEKFVEDVDFDTDHADLYQQRLKIVNEFSSYLRNKYWKEIMLAKNWEIILTAKSKL